MAAKLCCDRVRPTDFLFNNYPLDSMAGKYKCRNSMLVVVKSVVALLLVSVCEVAEMLATSVTLMAVSGGMFTTTIIGVLRPGPKVTFVLDRVDGQLLLLTVNSNVSVILPVFVIVKV